MITITTDELGQGSAEVAVASERLNKVVADSAHACVGVNQKGSVTIITVAGCEPCSEVQVSYEVV